MATVDGSCATTPFKNAFFNLIKNSYEAIEASGKIDVELISDTKNISLTFSDSGKGIPMHLLPYLGQKKLSFGKKGGTGLGIYQVKKMIEKCKGQFEMSSVENKGTRIKLTIPKALLAKSLTAI